MACCSTYLEGKGDLCAACGCAERQHIIAAIRRWWKVGDRIEYRRRSSGPWYRGVIMALRESSEDGGLWATVGADHGKVHHVALTDLDSVEVR